MFALDLAAMGNRLCEIQGGPEETPGARTLGQWALALAPALMLAVLLLRPTTNSDLFWQVTLGELTLDAGGPVLREPFSAPHLGEPIAALSWLGHAAMALALRLAGWSGLRLLDAACWCGGFWAAAWACRRAGASAIVLAAVLGLTFLAGLPTAILRPQSFAVLCFGLMLALLRTDWRAGTKVLAAAPLFLLWQNLHPSVSLAVVVAGAAAAGGWMAWLRGRSAAVPLAETLLVPLAALAMVCTPDGFSIFATAARNTELSLMIGASEWYPLWHPVNRPMALLIAIVAGFAGQAAWRRRARIDWRELAVTGALTVMTVLFYRFVVFWAISLIPLLARTGMPALDALSLPEPARRLLARRPPRFAAALSVAAVAVCISVLHPVRFREHLAIPAIAKLREQHVKGTVFADFPLGGPLIHMGYPDWRVAYDGRYYQYSRAEWARFAAIQAGRFTLADIVRTYRPVAFVLNRKRNARLLAQVERHPDEWREIERTERVVVFIRNHR